MVVPKLVILLCCTSLSLCSDKHSHTIPVEGYEAELQNLGEHVEIPETPVKVIKITKTIAVKVPVPYPVKVIEKVPYPVHVNKPYPVPVPHIVKVPHSEEPANQYHGQEALDLHNNPYQKHNELKINSYKVHEIQHQSNPVSEDHHDGPTNFDGGYGSNEGYYSDHEDQNGYQHSFDPIGNYGGHQSYK